MHWTIVLATLAMCAQSAAAQSITTATDGFTYFNRLGATAEQHFSDLETCRQQVRRVAPPFGGDGAIMVAIEGAVVLTRGRAANFENCMVAKGWRVARMQPELARELSRLEEPALAARLGPLVGADIPDSEIIRRFRNDAADSAVQLFETPGPSEPVSLSVKAMPDRPDWTREEQRAERDLARSFGRMPRSATPPDPLRDRELAELPSDAAVIVIHVGMPMRSASASPYFRAGVIFERVPLDNRPAWSTDGLPNVIIAKPPGRLVAPAGQRMNEGTLMFRAPPGRWRLVAMNQAAFSVSFCLGSPSFEIGAGEVVYAGAYYTDLRPRGPDMSLERAQEALANAPALSQRLRAAEYENGDTFNCSGAYAYAYEVPGAPFRPGYVGGSAAGPSSSAAPAGQ